MDQSCVDNIEIALQVEGYVSHYADGGSLVVATTLPSWAHACADVWLGGQRYQYRFASGSDTQLFVFYVADSEAEMCPSVLAWVGGR